MAPGMTASEVICVVYESSASCRNTKKRRYITFVSSFLIAAPPSCRAGPPRPLRGLGGMSFVVVLEFPFNFMQGGASSSE